MRTRSSAMRSAAAQKQSAWPVRAYQLRDREQVAAFLQRHGFLLELLAEAPEHIQRPFGPEAQLALEVFSDPEAEEEEAFILVLTGLPPEEARRRLERQDE